MVDGGSEYRKNVWRELNNSKLYFKLVLKKDLKSCTRALVLVIGLSRIVFTGQIPVNLATP